MSAQNVFIMVATMWHRGLLKPMVGVFMAEKILGYGIVYSGMWILTSSLKMKAVYSYQILAPAYKPTRSYPKMPK